MMADVEKVEVVVAHQACATVRVGDVFLKIDGDQRRTDREVEAMAMAPIPTPEVLWRRPPALALAALPGTALGRLGEPSTASPAAWAAAGDALYDLATLTLGHEEHLADVVAGYGTDVDLDVIRGYWSLRSLLAARWLIEHGFDPSSPGCEFDVLRSRM
jgi:hypothetical protein